MISKALRKALLQLTEGMTLAAISQECGVSQPQLHRFLSGERTLRLDSADRLAVYLDLVICLQRKVLA